MSARRPSRRPRAHQVRGERTAAAKLTRRDVLWARRELGRPPTARWYSLRQLARMLGVSAPALWDAVHGYTWSHLEPRSRSRRS